MVRRQKKMHFDMKTKLYLILFLIGFSFQNQAQSIYQHTSKHTIYDFLNEASTQKIIDINSAIQPYTRSFIADKLLEINGKKEGLNKRQQKELEFFLKDFNKEIKRKEFNEEYNSQKFFSKKTWFHRNENKRLDAIFYSSNKFQVTVNPIVGIDFLVSDKIYRRYYGGEINSYLGKGFTAYFSFRDVSENEELIDPNYFNTISVGVNRPNREKSVTDFSEVRGGITYSWKWGTVGLIQDQFQWGNSYQNSNIFSGNFPAIPHLKLQVKPVKWLEFNYIHGWLNSNVIDSTRTYTTANGSTRNIYRRKAIAANMFTVKPIKGLHLSFGNSTIYSDSAFNPAYLIPFFFYRSVDHAQSNQSNTAGQNGQLFMDVSSRNIPYVHLYGTIFIDELKFSTVFDKEKQRNQLGFKIGVASYNIAKTNLGIVVEYTRSNPYAYQHGLESTTFANNGYNLGHYLRSNAEEFLLELNYKPISKLKCKLHFLSIRKGRDNYGYSQGFGGFSGIPFMETVRYRQKEFGLTIQYEILHDIHAKGSLIFSNITDETESYTPEFQRGKNTFASLSLNWGF